MRTSILLAIVLGELAWGGILCVGRLGRPPVPKVNLSRLPPATAEVIERLQTQAERRGVEDWFRLGEAYLAHGYLSESAAVLQRVTEQDPGNYPAAWCYARSLERLGRLDEAMAAFRRAGTLDQGQHQPDCLYRVGKCALRAADARAAEEAFQTAGKYPLPLLELARLWQRTGRGKESTELLETLSDSSHLQIHVETALVEAARLANDPVAQALAEERSERSSFQNRYRSEWVDLDTIRKRDGFSGILNRAYERSQKQPRVALDEMLSILDSTPREFMEPYVLPAIQVAMAAGDTATVERIADLFRSRMELSPEIRHWCGEALWESNQRERAVELFQRALARKDSAQSALHLAEDAVRRKDDAARQKWEAEAARMQGVTDYLASDFASADEHLRHATALHPQDEAAWYYRGETQWAQGDWNSAEAAYRRCLELDPRFGRARERLSALPSLQSRASLQSRGAAGSN